MKTSYDKNYNPADIIDDYDPYEHREIERPSSDFDSLVHLVKGVLGTGILALPEAYKYLGLYVGLFSAIFVGLFAMHTFTLLIRSMYLVAKIKKVPYVTYPEAFRECILMGPGVFKKLVGCGAMLPDIFIVSYQIGTVSAYIIFIAITIKGVLKHYYHWDASNSVYIIMMFLPLLLLMIAPDLRGIANYSFVGNILILTSLLIVYAFCFADLPPINERPAYNSNFEEYAVTIGVILFAYQCVGPVCYDPIYIQSAAHKSRQVVAIEREMKNPQHFLPLCGVLVVGFLSLILINSFTGFIGYWRYGDDVQSSITYNLPLSNPWSQIVNLLYGMAIYFSCALNAFVPASILWDHYISIALKDSKHLMAWFYINRFCVILVALLFALSIPMLGPCISIVGVVGLSQVGVSFPAFMDICIRWQNKNFGNFKWILWKNIVIIVFGEITLFIGITGSVIDIQQRLKAGHY